MDVYTSGKIRNVVVLGHGSCGKTTLVEAMAYVTGIINRQGRIEEGNTISDYDKEEIKRLFSISTTLVPIIWEDTKINIIDTPGYFDFVGEVLEGIQAADSAIIVISAKAGVEIGTMKAWNYCEKYNIPRMFFITDMDDDNASDRQVIAKLYEHFGKKILPFQLPLEEKEKAYGYVDIVAMKGNRLKDNNTYEECAISEDRMQSVIAERETLLDTVAETSEDLMEKYFNGEEFTEDEMSKAIRENVINHRVVPVLMGSGLQALGITTLLQAINRYFPSPVDVKLAGIHKKTEDIFEANYDENLPFTAKVFKTIADPFIGKFSLIKVCSGILNADSVIYNTAREIEEKISRLYVLRGKEQIEVKELRAGDIGAIGKLLTTTTGDTLSTKSNPVIYEQIDSCKPYTYLRFQAKNKGDDDKISQALSRMMEEDLTLKVVNDKENRQSLLYGIGEQHLEVAISKLLSKYKVEIELKKPKIPYKETIRKKVKVQGKYKKQSGGHGQYGDVHIEFEPLDNLEVPYLFEEKIFGGAVPKNYFPAVEKGIAESVQKGPLAGYPVVGIKATLVDGSYHPVDSSEYSFKMATIQAFKAGILDASPILLEPIVTLNVIIPDKYTGDILGDLNKRRGRVLGMNPKTGGMQEITADIPLSQTAGYATTLRSITGGYGEYSYELNRYEQAPSDVVQKVIEENRNSTIENEE